MSTTEEKVGNQRKPKVMTYYVNGMAQVTDERKLTPRVILTHAGFTPPEEYRLFRDDGDKELTDLDKQEPIRNEERFTTLFKGPTPVS